MQRHSRRLAGHAHSESPKRQSRDPPNVLGKLLDLASGVIRAELKIQANAGRRGVGHTIHIVPRMLSGRRTETGWRRRERSRSCTEVSLGMNGHPPVEEAPLIWDACSVEHHRDKCSVILPHPAPPDETETPAAVGRRSALTAVNMPAYLCQKMQNSCRPQSTEQTVRLHQEQGQGETFRRHDQNFRGRAPKCFQDEMPAVPAWTSLGGSVRGFCLRVLQDCR